MLFLMPNQQCRSTEGSYHLLLLHEDNLMRPTKWYQHCMGIFGNFGVDPGNKSKWTAESQVFGTTSKVKLSILCKKTILFHKFHGNLSSSSLSSSASSHTETQNSRKLTLTTVLQLLHRVIWRLQLRCGGFCWSKVLLYTCPCWCI